MKTSFTSQPQSQDLSPKLFRGEGDHAQQILDRLRYFASPTAMKSRFKEVSEIQIVGRGGPMELSAPLTVLNLECLQSVAQSERCSGQVRWYSATSPQLIAGALIEDYQGTYLSSNSGRLEVVYCTPEHEERYPIQETGSRVIEILAAICAAREAGFTKEIVEQAMDAWSSKENLNPTGLRTKSPPDGLAYAPIF